MIIAIPTKENSVDNHFGHCKFFTLYYIENNLVESVETMDSPNGCGCKSNLTELLTNKGVSLLLAGNMGEGAVNKLVNANIAVIRGCSGPVDLVVNNYIEGTLKDSGLTCVAHHGANNHTCEH